MARPKGRGGYQRPSKPAAVSGPGALSGRTDGGPGQPIRVAPGGDYGDRKATVEQQKAAPMAQQGKPFPQGVLRTPTGRGSEPMTAGVDAGPGAGAPPQPRIGESDNIELIVREAYRITQSPHLLRLLDRLVR